MPACAGMTGWPGRRVSLNTDWYKVSGFRKRVEAMHPRRAFRVAARQPGDRPTMPLPPNTPPEAPKPDPAPAQAPGGPREVPIPPPSPNPPNAPPGPIVAAG